MGTCTHLSARLLCIYASLCLYVCLHTRLYTRWFASLPCFGKHISFDGRFPHAAPADLARLFSSASSDASTHIYAHDYTQVHAHVYRGIHMSMHMSVHTPAHLFSASSCPDALTRTCHACLPLYARRYTCLCACHAQPTASIYSFIQMSLHHLLVYG